MFVAGREGKDTPCPRASGAQRNQWANPCDDDADATFVGNFLRRREGGALVAIDAEDVRAFLLQAVRGLLPSVAALRAPGTAEHRAEPRNEGVCFETLSVAGRHDFLG